MKATTFERVTEQKSFRLEPIKKATRRRLQSRWNWMESLETRMVLSAPPVFGNIPAVVNVPEATGADYYATGYFRVDLPVSDPDTPPPSLRLSVDSASPLPPGVYDNVLLLGNYMLYGAGDGPYQRSITFRVTDDTGLSDTRTILFNVTNSPPIVAEHPYLQSNFTPLVGQSAQFFAQARDFFYLGSDTLQAWWDFGDGVVTAPQTLTDAETYGYGPGRVYFYPVSATHSFARPGNYTVRVFVKDDDGAVTAWTLPTTVTVASFGVDPMGVLRIGGTSGNDNIHVSPAAGGKTNLFIGGAYRGAFAASSVIAYGYEGDDVLDSAPDLNIPVEFHGGPGNDLLRGGAKDDLLFGEGGNDGLDSRGGNDLLVGGDGNDIAFAGSGNDLLIGGNGSDSLYGEAGDDILISGYSDFDTDVSFLRSAVGAWNLPGNYEGRIATIRYSFLKAGFNVHAGGANDVDWLTGGTYGVPDQDLFMGSMTQSKFADRAPNEWIDYL